MLYTDDKSTAAAESLKVQRAEEAEKLKAFWESQKTAKVVEAAAPVETVANTFSAAPPSPTVKYTDVTAQWLEEATPNSHVVQDAQEYVKDGVTYKVDGHNVVLDITDSNLPDNIVKEQIEKVFTDRQTKNVERIIVIRNGEIEKVYKK